MNLLKPLINLFKKEKIQELEEKTVPKSAKEKAIEEGKSVPLKNGSWGFTEEQKMSIMPFIAQGLTHSMVVRECWEKLGIKINTKTIYDYASSDKWIPVIKQLREDYKNHPESLDATDMNVRIRRMDYAMDRAAAKDDLRVIVSTNEQVRKEFEKNGGDINLMYINNPVYQQLNTLSNEELLRKHEVATKKIKERNDGKEQPKK